MGRKAVGSAYESPVGSGHWYASITTATGRKSKRLLTCANQAAADARAAFIAEQVARLRKVGLDQHVKRAIERGAEVSDAELPKIRGVVDGLIERWLEAPPAPDAFDPGMTFRDFAERWTDGRLSARWPDRVAAKASSERDAGRFKKYVYPHVKGVALSAFSLDDAERVMRELPPTLSTASRRHVAQLLHRTLKLAAYPARLIAKTPIPAGFLPKVTNTRAKSWLYPDEDRALLARQSVPLLFRVLYGFLAREGLRSGEALALRWQDVDLARGVLTLDENKTNDPRAWALDAGVLAALMAWRTLVPKDELRVFPIEGPVVERLADVFRDHLREAKLERTALYEDSDARRPIRIHDLRATFVTLALAGGRSEAWVQDRTGHRSSQMIQRYRRAARSASELGLGSLSSLGMAVPELAAIVGQSSEHVARRRETSGRRSKSPRNQYRHAARRRRNGLSNLPVAGSIPAGRANDSATSGPPKTSQQASSPNAFATDVTLAPRSRPRNPRVPS